ncbi:ABC transporter permease [Candidimonas sp. SYP-B2681]|uniref:FtsX-like permease family protein n=1 Tax=Candidimonas sp. SYP-B2681 TaxID=2497686 RepID=UPI000F8886B8|nr:ABC transporter permease [Candidimonas sp. SYP-B2681]RTZ48129.1 ABC transporter permease [Candidimonas sp. SYP-B2681]
MRTLSSVLPLLLGTELRTHTGRVLINIIAIAIGVAMGYAVFLVNHTALAEFSKATRLLVGQADLEIRGPRNGFDETIYERLAHLPQVAAASPMVEVEAYLPTRRESLRLLGIDAFQAAKVTPGLIGRPANNQTKNLIYLDPSAVFLSPAAMAWLDLKPDDTLAVQVGSNTLDLRVAGTLPVTNEALRLGVMDIGAAQWRLNLLGSLQSINLKLQPGVELHTFQQDLEPLLPPGVVALTPEDSQRVTAGLSRAYRVNLGVLALMALFTGAFLIFSAQAASVIRRRTQIALLRALGMTKGNVLRLVLAEGLVQGLLGALGGIVLGWLIAAAVLHYAGGDLGGGYFPGVQAALRSDAVVAAVFVALGLGASLLGSLAPAWEASRAQPAQALKAGDEETALKRLASPWPALAMILSGAALTQAPPVNGLPIMAYVAIGLLLVGTIMSMPRLTHWILSLLPRGRKAVSFLALAQLSQAPGRAAIGMAGILVSFSLMAAMAIMVTSFRVSLEQWLDIVLPAELYLEPSSSGNTGYFSVADQQSITAVPGIARVEFMSTTKILLDPRLPAVALIAKPVDKMRPEASLALIEPSTQRGTVDAPPIWISEAMTDLYAMHLGQRISLPIEGRMLPFTIGGIWRDYTRQYGAIVIDLNDFARLSGRHRITSAALWLSSGANVSAVQQTLQQRLRGDVQIREAGEMRESGLRVFDRSFAVTYLLEVITILIGLSGIGVSFSAQAMARAREFGMLRHIGFTRAQIGSMLALEGALLGLLGMAAGLALGCAIALVLIHVVNPQSFHWTISLHMPWGLLVGVAFSLVAGASLVALISGRRVMSAEAVRSVREDW